MNLRARPLATLSTVFALVVTTLVAVVALGGPAAAAGTVTVTVQGPGVVTGDGINCTQGGGPDCSQLYEDVQVCDPELKPPCHDETPEVVLTAGPDSGGFTFVGFTGACTSASGRTCTITVNSSKNVTAVFADTSAPTVSLTSPANGAKVGASLSLAATAGDNVGISRVDFFVGGVVKATTSGPYQAVVNSSNLPEGDTTVQARAYDTSGNMTPSATRTITIDHTAPSMSVTGPSGQIFGPGTTQTWSIVSSDAVSGPPSVQCSLVAAAASASFGPCSGGSAGHSVSSLPEGSYKFDVRATDGAGNTFAVQRLFTVDATPPDTSVISGPAAGTVVASRAVTFGLSASEAGSTFQCRLYPSGTAAPPFASCSGPAAHSVAGLADGGYRFEVRGVDTVGNTDASPAVRGFVVDASAPVATFTKQPPRKVKTKKKKAKVAFAFTAEPGATFRCSLDGAAFTACPASVTYKVKPGRHTFRVVAVDAAGNVQAPPTTSTFKVKRVTTRR